VNNDGVGGFLKEHAVVADAKAQEAFELAGEWFDAASAGFGVAVNGFEDGHSDVLRDGADLNRDLRLEVNILHWGYFFGEAPRICSMVKPRSATTCSKGMP